MDRPTNDQRVAHTINPSTTATSVMVYNNTFVNINKNIFGFFPLNCNSKRDARAHDFLERGLRRPGQ